MRHARARRRRDRRPRHFAHRRGAETGRFARCTSSCRSRPAAQTDVAARRRRRALSRTFGQQVVVENKSGANGNLGVESVAKSTPDGYTILVATDSVSSNPHVYKTTIDVLKDLAPVTQFSRQPIALAAHPSLGVNTLADVTALAKQQPGLRFATGSGVGAPQARPCSGTRDGGHRDGAGAYRGGD